MRRKLSNRAHLSYRLARKRTATSGSPSVSPYVPYSDRSPLVCVPGASHIIKDLHEDRRK